VETYDLAIIGGGINGCGIARDAAGRGLKVFLCEQGDLAGATSSASTKLIHGGLRYLEYYEFRLVREALQERERLLTAAPHIIWPLRFVLPHHKGLRPRWLIRLGLFLYDHLGGRRLLPPTRVLDLARDPAGEPLKPAFRRAFEYSDCWVEDSRLVVLNAADAVARGATVVTRTRCLGARREAGLWRLELDRDGARSSVAAHALVNAAGPWVTELLARVTGANSPARVRLVKGSHIIVRRLFRHERAYIFQNADGRIVFAIPYEQDFTLIGTTDVDYQGDPGDPAISPEETRYLCDAANEYFKQPIGPEDVVHSYAGVRPLYDDGAREAKAATRDYVLELEAPDGQPPLLSVFGGKITTFRRLAESVMAKLEPQLPAEIRARLGKPWTARATLPGGDFAVDGRERLADLLQAVVVDLPRPLALRLARAYGTRARDILGEARTLAALGQDFGAGLTESEVRYLMRQEWAQRAEDVLWRRSKLGLRMDAAQRQRLEDFMQAEASRLAKETQQGA